MRSEEELGAACLAVMGRRAQRKAALEKSLSQNFSFPRFYCIYLLASSQTSLYVACLLFLMPKKCLLLVQPILYTFGLLKSRITLPNNHLLRGNLLILASDSGWVRPKGR